MLLVGGNGLPGRPARNNHQKTRPLVLNPLFMGGASGAVGAVGRTVSASLVLNPPLSSRWGWYRAGHC